MMKPFLQVLRFTVLIVVLGCITVACSKNDHPSSLDYSVDSSSLTPAPVAKSNKPAKEKKDLTISSPSTVPATADVDSSEQTNKTDHSGTTGKKDNQKAPNYNVSEPFDLAKPTLMGFSIDDSIEGVLARFGKPISESTMNDGPRQLQIVEYPGFLFGAADNKAIIFIEVTSDQLNPGLNQFRIGQTVDEAQKALGPADSLNEFVMIYEANGLILKCDLDPGTKKVLSIKLFAE